MEEHVIATTDELSKGDRKLVEIEGREIAVFYVDGEYHAYTNWCAHQAGPVCEGKLTGTSNAEFDRDSLTVDLEWCKEGEVLNCPWHGWEYDVTDGSCLSKEKVQLPSHSIKVENDEIIISL